MSEFEKSMSSQESSIEIRESKVLMKAFDIVIEGENHTLGHLLQSHINKLFKEKNIFVGYMNPHPLEEKIIFRINVENIKGLKDIFTQTCAELVKQCDILSNSVLKEFKKKIVFKPGSKKSPKGKSSVPEEEAPAPAKVGKGKGKAKSSVPKEDITVDTKDNGGGPA